MGTTFNTSMAILNIVTDEPNEELDKLNGRLVSTADARYLIDKYGKDIIKFKHAYLTNESVKFVPSDKRDGCFSLITPLKDIHAEDKRYLRVHPLHKLASNLIMLRNFEQIILDGVVINKDEILSTFGDSFKVYYDEYDYIIPDAVVNTSRMCYYLEFNNTHKVDSTKIAKYRKLHSLSQVPFKVIEINIADICDDMKSKPNFNWSELLESRVLGISDYKRIIDISEKPIKEFTPFGRCPFCDTPMLLGVNASDVNYSNSVIKSVPRIHFSVRNKDEDDRVSIGSAVCYCPHCEAENRYQPLYCPECLTKRGRFVPLKLLTSKANRTFLHCPFNLMLSELDHDAKVSDDKACNFSLTVYDEHGNYDKQIRVVDDFNKLFQRGIGSKQRKKLDEVIAIAKKNKEWKGN